MRVSCERRGQWASPEKGRSGACATRRRWRHGPASGSVITGGAANPTVPACANIANRASRDTSRASEQAPGRVRTHAHCSWRNQASRLEHGRGGSARRVSIGAQHVLECLLPFLRGPLLRSSTSPRRLRSTTRPPRAGSGRCWHLRCRTFRYRPSLAEQRLGGPDALFEARHPPAQVGSHHRELVAARADPGLHDERPVCHSRQGADLLGHQHRVPERYEEQAATLTAAPAGAPAPSRTRRYHRIWQLLATVRRYSDSRLLACIVVPL